MKKTFLLSLLFCGVVLSVPISAFATSGACSDHGGVDCSAGPQANGDVICNDGWTGSSVSYESMVECQTYQPTNSCVEPMAYCTQDQLNTLRMDYGSDLESVGGSDQYSPGEFNGYPQAIQTCQQQIDTYNSEMQTYEDCLSNSNSNSNIAATPGTCPPNASYVNGQCTCNSGYGANTNGDSCIPATQACQALYGLNSYADSNNHCRVCGSGSILFNNDSCITFVFTKTLLPDAIINQPYSQNINFTYTGTDTPLISFSVSDPSNLQVESINVEGYSGVAALQLIPRQAGQFTITATASVNNTQVATQTFNLTVDALTVTAPTSPALTNQNSVPPVVIQAPIITQKPTIQAPTSLPVKKVIVKKPIQPTTTVQNTQIQGAVKIQVQTPTQSQTKSKTQFHASNNVFFDTWNFIKSIFK